MYTALSLGSARQDIMPLANIKNESKTNEWQERQGKSWVICNTIHDLITVFLFGMVSTPFVGNLAMQIRDHHLVWGNPLASLQDLFMNWLGQSGTGAWVSK